MSTYRVYSMVNDMSYVNPLLYFSFLFPGNQHLKQVAVCNCESHAVTLVRANIWPGSPDKPTIGFHFKLMDLAETLFLHNQVPLKDFAEMLIELVPALHPILVSV